ncbi:hypothetical protein [Paenibacillus medicaginis]|uniref:PPM-type phosphatase domain-containing protein n=1 Tax=Paenibacillus medicaginis TaxID=1470560 RepID=A0ABV5BWE5_9BACL
MKPLLSLLSIVKKRGDLMKRDCFTYISSQTSEQPLSSYESRFRCRYGYGRSSDSANAGESGQDFAALQMEGPVCTFVLCDGVGMSYRGEFAARYLGQSLLDWLSADTELSLARLNECLRLWAVSAAEELEKEPIPHRSDLLRNVLEEKRRQGSQAMYICGKIELPSRGRKGKMTLAWQGDSRIRLWKGTEEAGGIFGDTFRTAERWSTVRGPVGGQPHWYETRLSAGEQMRLQMYTDGLADLDPIREQLPDDQIQVLLDSRHTDGLDDDAAFLELQWNE